MKLQITDQKIIPSLAHLYRPFTQSFWQTTEKPIIFTTVKTETNLITQTMWTRLIVACLLLYSCSASKQVETRLYFGQFKLDGGTVSEKEWSEFVEQYVTKVFPDGSTIENATGNWYDTAQHKLVTEPSKVVIAIGKPSAAQSQMIDSLRHWYKQIHNQQSVLRVDKKVKARMF